MQTKTCNQTNITFIEERHNRWLSCPKRILMAYRFLQSFHNQPSLSSLHHDDDNSDKKWKSNLQIEGRKGRRLHPGSYFELNNVEKMFREKWYFTQLLRWRKTQHYEEQWTYLNVREWANHVNVTAGSRFHSTFVRNDMSIWQIPTKANATPCRLMYLDCSLKQKTYKS